ncbi:hypothetical protein KY389_07030 [Paracoccus bogoriensis]|uniref:hypothetical protein n=1 Tax=Paracoccus bogoriensis TaxID=242065 RepID=UPI001CA5B792|nr:hypothetical protein [Paracoccus bogoriensis]MBW7056449.1 hypothetical protein [Paracoccus bogoriensis]
MSFASPGFGRRFARSVELLWRQFDFSALNPHQCAGQRQQCGRRMTAKDIERILNEAFAALWRKWGDK